MSAERPSENSEPGHFKTGGRCAEVLALSWKPTLGGAGTGVTGPGRCPADGTGKPVRQRGACPSGERHGVWDAEG